MLHKEEENQREFQLIDLPKEELKQIRYMFEKGRIPFFKNLIVQLMRRTQQLPDKLTKLFGSFIDGEMAPISWEIFLQVLEEEVKANETKTGPETLDAGSKTIFLKTPSRRNLSVNPTKFFYPQYTIDFCEFIEIESFKVTLVLINNSTLAILDKNLEKLLNSVTFSRDFQRHAQGQLHKKKVLDEKRRKDESLKRLRMSRLSSFMRESFEEVKEKPIEYNFDVMLYAGLKKKSKKRSRRRKKNRDSSQISGLEDDDVTSTFESNFTGTHSKSRRRSYRSKIGTEDSFVDTVVSQKSHISSRTRLGTGKARKSKNAGFREALKKATEKTFQTNRNDAQNTTFHSRQNTPKSRGTRSHLGQTRSRNFRRLNTGGKLPSITNSITGAKRAGDRFKVKRENRANSNTSKYMKRSSRVRVPRQNVKSYSRRKSKSYLLQGLNEKAAITNLIIDIKSKLKKGDETRERMLYNDKEKKEVKKIFEKFKVIADIHNVNRNVSTKGSKSVIQRRTRKNRQQEKTSKSFNKESIELHEDDYKMGDFSNITYSDFEEYKKKLNGIIQDNKANRLWRAINDFK